MSTVRAAATQVIRLYQAVAAAWTRGACRYVPTCSEYARQAITRHGVIRGLGLAAWRLLRCHPLGRHGYDPVP
jgi:putative membrane protein insertion efficiency factor